jgi:uncharacterized protein (TIRG00374 family)
MITKRNLLISFSLAMSAVLGIVFVNLFLSDDQLENSLASAQWSYLLPTPFLYLLALYLRSKRWSVILDVTIDSSHSSLISPTLVGYMVNALAPVRLGDFVRGYYVSVREACGVLTTMGTLAVEKALDTATVLILFVVGGLVATNLLATSDAFEEIPGGATAIVVIALLPAVGVLGMFLFWRIFNTGRATSDVENSNPSKIENTRRAIAARVSQFSSGAAGLKSRNVLAATALYSFIIWALEVATYTLVAMAFGAHDSLPSLIALIAVMAVVLATSNIAIAIPTAFGGLGTFELVATGTMASMGIGPEFAGAIAITTHFILLATAVVSGSIALIADHRARHAFKVRFLGRKASHEPVL